ncbi:MAG TPA: PQQ-binding-like beta-propeller repeat protein [Verrucomicrobiae bacterium]|jgi:outer membrane protein assembly factor BamB|nr:PQQ-binding-like beta-propeller repeat protein [Verrucomicrobiae bacterium]
MTRLRALATAAFLLAVFAANADLRFAWLSDTHIGSPNSEADLRASVKDINSLDGLSFVIVSGDVTEFGSHAQFVTAKALLDPLRVPCHVIPGNHDCKWSESGATEFAKIWGDDRFVFDAEGYCFIGLHEGPVMKMGDGHFAPQDLRWLDATLNATPRGQPIIFVTHYPVDNEIDNWFEALDELKKFNTQAILVGHGHRNKKMDFEGVPGVMGRSNLRATNAIGGYSLVEIKDGEMTVAERAPAVETKPVWDTIRMEKHDYAADTNQWPRPDFSVNSKYPRVKNRWQFNANWTVASSPAVAGRRVFFGDGSETVRSLDLKSGTPQWEANLGAAVYSTPEVADNRVVFGSTDGDIYALSAKTGSTVWKFQTARPIVASPCVAEKIVYIGGSDGHFRALDIGTGRLLWDYPDVGGFVETRPLVRDGTVIFGAWDSYLYALDARTGALKWKWKGQSPGKLGLMYSPAAEWPVAAHGKVFVVAPDRRMTSLDMADGTQIWRTAQWQVRESIGMSADQSRFYVRTMPGIIAAFSTEAAEPRELWELDGHIRYDINSAMLEERGGVLFYGSKNGVLIAADAKTGGLLWEHKLGVTVLNTVVPLGANDVLVADVDGKITRVQAGR